MRADSTKLTFRRAVIADVSNIVALVESAYRGEISKQGWTTEADLLEGQRTDPDEVVHLIAVDSGCILLCEQQGQLLASVNLQWKNGECYLGMFSVRPNLQNAGVGKVTLAEAERLARDDQNCSLMHMTVIVQRAALIEWYERRGYRRTGETKPWPYGDLRFGIPKVDDLAFCVLRKEL